MSSTSLRAYWVRRACRPRTRPPIRRAPPTIHRKSCLVRLRHCVSFGEQNVTAVSVPSKRTPPFFEGNHSSAKNDD
jgi:hypothetical protein